MKKHADRFKLIAWILIGSFLLQNLGLLPPLQHAEAKSYYSYNSRPSEEAIVWEELPPVTNPMWKNWQASEYKEKDILSASHGYYEQPIGSLYYPLYYGPGHGYVQLDEKNELACEYIYTIQPLSDYRGGLSNYIYNQLLPYHYIGSSLSGELRTDAQLHVITINGATYLYTSETYAPLGDPYYGSNHYPEKTWNWFEGITVIGSYVLKVRFAWTPGYNGIMGIEDGVEKVLSRFRFPMVERRTMQCMTPLPGEEGLIDPAPTTNSSVFIVSASPKSGTRSSRMCDTIQLSFNRRIEGIHPEAGGLSLYDAETDELVYTTRDLSYETVRFRNSNGSGLEQSLLSWKLPSYYSAQNPFYDGKTYYLQMDEGFISFEDVPDTVSIKGKDVWTYTVGNEPITKRFFFYNADDNYVGDSTVSLNDAWFSELSTDYNSRLAETSMAMCLAASNGPDSSHGSEYIEAFLKTLGFSDIRVNNGYKQMTTADSIGVAVASKNLQDKTIIAVAVRGGNYKTEWAGNFRVGDSGSHKGFQIAADEVYSFLEDYIRSYGSHMRDKIAIWISGYSRASAVANLTAAMLDDTLSCGGRSFLKTSLFAYCFEVPACTVDKNVDSDRYSNIFNIINPIDPVPRVAPFQWGFTRYGINLYLPDPDFDQSDYNRFIQTVKDNFGPLVRLSAPSAEDPLKNQAMFLNELIDQVCGLIPDRKMFVRDMQDLMIGLMQILNDERYEEERALLMNTLTSLFDALKTANQWNPTFAKLIDGFILTEGPSSIFSVLFITLCIITAARERDVVTKLDISNPSSFFQALPRVVTADTLLRVSALAPNLFQAITDRSAVTFPHHLEWTMAWMQTLSGSSYRRLEANSTSGSTQYAKLLVKFNCPVNVYLYAAGSEDLLASILNDGSIYISNDAAVYAYTEANGAKVFACEGGEDYVWKAEAAEDGQMTVNLLTQTEAYGTIVRAENYYDLPLIKGKVYTLTADTGLYGTDSRTEMFGYEGETIEPDYKEEGKDLKWYSIRYRIRTSGNTNAGGAVSLPAKAVSGTYVTLAAEAFDGYRFDGWYDENNGSLLSDQAEYAFRIDKNISVIARFSLLPKQEEESSVPPAPVETTATSAAPGTVPSEPGSSGSEENSQPSESSRSSAKQEPEDTDNRKANPVAWLLPVGILLAGSCTVLIVLHSRKKKEH